MFTTWQRIVFLAPLLSALAGCATPPGHDAPRQAMPTAVTASQARPSQASTAAKNKKLIQTAFDNWAKGQGNIFDLLSDDVQWTIAGSSPYSKTYYGKKQLIDEAVTPLTLRLATPITPKVRQLVSEGDTVVALWDGSATAKDGRPYRNTYSWAMTLKQGRITRVVAFLDMAEYDGVIQRVPAGK